ncbi:MAG TPA: hypothetical protein VNJ12_13975 [Candidatus Dormibacteraeota bacterium]|nr:hypothetical protein [Candidatus Dormibacteraeota bacterium]
MRCMVKVTFPVETGNEAIRSGKLQKLVKGVIDDMKPEAVYFTSERGQRGGIFVVDLKEPSELLRIAEPFFLGLSASVEVLPAMTPEDLMKAGPHLEKAAKQYAWGLFSGRRGGQIALAWPAFAARRAEIWDRWGREVRAGRKSVPLFARRGVRLGPRHPRSD